MTLLLGKGQCVACAIESMDLDWALRGFGLWVQSGKGLMVVVEVEGSKYREGYLAGRRKMD